MTEFTPQSILIVDDTPANLTVLSTMLTQHGYKVRPAINGNIALMSVLRDRPDLILLDIRMPEMDGYEVCARLKADERTRDIPVIFISALDDIEDKLKAFQAGGVDYITKPFQLEEVLARVQAHVTLQAQRRAIEEQLVQIAQLNQFKDQLLRIVSHDLKNPISVIIGYADLLLEEGSESAVREYVPRILRSAHFMSRMVGDLLTLSQAEGDFPLELQELDINRVITACLGEFELAAQEKQIALHANLSPPLVGQIDPFRLGQVFSNLISNAIKYTLAGGTVEVSSWAQNGYAVVRVADTGLGIPPEDLQRIFEQFYRVNAKQHLDAGGTGLGLSIAKALVEKHGGTIEVSSVLGEGSAFTVKIPLMG